MWVPRSTGLLPSPSSVWAYFRPNPNGATCSPKRGNSSSTHPISFSPPGLTILLTVLAYNLIGDGLRDALDPKLKR